MKKVIRSCIILVLGCGTAAFAALGTVNIQNHNNSISDQGQLFGGGLTGGTYYTGIYSWTNAGGTDLGTQVPGWGFCIELTQIAQNGWHDVIELKDAPLPSLYGTPMGNGKADSIRELWGRYFDSDWTTGADKQLAEAFNAAIWEIIYETDSSWDVTSGAGFYATIEQAATANTWLAALNGDTAWFEQNVVAISRQDGQDYIVLVPEPATMALLGFGTLALLRKRK